MKLNRSWSELLTRYKADHQHPVNQACHAIGVPMIVASIPTAATIVGIPLAAGLFSVGWTFQFVGHWFEGKKPVFMDDKRALLIGVLWWAEKMHLTDLETEKAA